MKKSKFKDSQIIGYIKRAEAGAYFTQGGPAFHRKAGQCFTHAGPGSA